jgi:hypothetical protein
VGVHVLQNGELPKLLKLKTNPLKKIMSKVVVGKMQLKVDVDVLWNFALDDYEAKGNDGNESSVGDELNLEVPTIAVQKQRLTYPFSITKLLSASQPNVAPSIVSMPLILQAGASEVVAMFNSNSNSRVPSQMPTLAGNIEPSNLQGKFCVLPMQVGLNGFPNFNAMGQWNPLQIR